MLALGELNVSPPVLPHATTNQSDKTDAPRDDTLLMNSLRKTSIIFDLGGVLAHVN